MSRGVTLALACLSLALLILPLTHRKPGMPATLKADEPAYYLAALSLARDGDLRCEPEDLARLYEEFPYAPIQNLILSTDDGWHTVYYGKPYAYSMLAAPFAALWKANGLVVFNTLLLVAMIWMSTFYLRRYNADWLAALFASGFFLMSTTYRYVYWLQPEMLNMFATAACLFFGLHAFEPSRDPSRDPRAFGTTRALWSRLPAWLTTDRVAIVASASALAVGVYNKPMLAAIGLPVCFRLVRHRCWRQLLLWLAAAAVTVGIFAGIGQVLTGHPTSYLGIDRQGYNVHTPHVMPVEPKEPTPAGTPVAAAEAELGKETAGWWWIFGVPQVSLPELREDFVYFLFGRHVGLVPYHPFAVIALGLFLAYGRRSAVRWTVLGSLALITLFFLTFLHHNWHGGGGFVGNRYFFMLYPAFLFLVTRIRPDWIVAPGFAAGGLFIGSLVFSPYGLAVPSPTLQAHGRNHPFQAFPLELSLRELPGYFGAARGDIYFYGRKDHLRPEGEELWIGAGGPSEIWIQSLEPITELTFDVRSQAPGNEVTFEIEGASERIVAGPDQLTRVVLKVPRPTMVRNDRDRAAWERVLDIYVYRMEIRTATGEMPRWREKGEHYFYLGCALTLVGEDR
ncbi:MAG: hypothetical protein GY719_18965 [bacterium]|nr:hypothetical protein [bacterium]